MNRGPLVLALLVMVFLAAIMICLLLICAPAEAQEVNTIGGAAVGYSVTGNHETQTFSTVYAGTRIKEVDSTAGVFAVVQYVGAEHDLSGLGAKLIAYQDIWDFPSLTLVADVGFADHIAENADGDKTTGITVGAGLVYKAGSVLGLSLYIQGVDTGPALDWIVYAGITAFRPEQLLPGL